MSTPVAQRFAGKVAIVTGASRGIGLAIAKRIVAEGGRVCITARKEEALAEAAATFPPGTVTSLAGKADDPEHRAAVMDHVAATYGGLDVLVNNAGINPFYGTTMELELGAARKLLEVNVIGTLGWVQAAYHHDGLAFKERRGNVVNLASVAGKVPSEGIGFYGVTKAAVMHLTMTLAAELGPEIRVNAVAPAVVKTDFAKALYEGREAEVSADYPLGRLGVPDDIAGAVMYFAAADAEWVTGQTLVLDGGLLSAGGTA
ncbi:MAG: SDR family oxidoreductase [Microbacteriaceae bacterium]|nr:SDR family oxidoreductase [Microbacteriaceae bacterium]